LCSRSLGGDMGILLGFLPFAVFALTSVLLGATKALFLGAATSAALMIRSRMRRETPKLLEGGSLLLFLALAIYSAVAGQTLSIVGVRLCVDTGLFAIVLVSLLARRPFTLQYARERVAREVWDKPAFVRTNWTISVGWLVAFLVIVVAEAGIVFVPAVPEKIGIAAVVLALLGAVCFTTWVTKQAQRSAPQHS
jgi:hypothetical protein